MSTMGMYVHYEINLLKQEWNVGYAADGFNTDVKELQRKYYLKNTHIKHATSVKNTRNRSKIQKFAKDS